jgi:hypothetical protein
MAGYNEIRDGEGAVDPPATTDAALVFIRRIHTPWTDRLKTAPGPADGPTSASPRASRATAR